jgi:CheY-like chemotaxis protein
MPDEDGFSLLRRLRNLRPEEGGRLPAVAVTAYEGDDQRAAAMQAGFHAYMTKPVSPVELVDTVAQMAGREQND